MEVMREVNVRPVLNGFVVQVGCQTLVFNRIEDVAENLVAYQKDPEGTEKKFAETAVNKTLGGGPVPEPVERLNRRTGLVQSARLQPAYGQEDCNAGEACCETTSAG
jgi:hypothetical protein